VDEWLDHRLPLLIFKYMGKGAKAITDAIVGNDFKTIVINEKAYTMYPPTIYKLSGCISCLSSINIDEYSTLKDMFKFYGDVKILAKALSWMIQGDDGLTDELCQGTLDEVVDALTSSFSLISTTVFQQAVSLMRSASLLAARER
jgi:hypothetical protein